VDNPHTYFGIAFCSDNQITQMSSFFQEYINNTVLLLKKQNNTQIGMGDNSS